MVQDRTGDLWFATREVGIFRYNGNGFQRITAREGLADDEVACVLNDSKGRVWVSSMNEGLVCLVDGQVVKRFTAPADIGDGEVWTVIEDRAGDIWFSSEGFGVYRYDGSTLRNYSTKQGLGVLAVQSIHQDRAGRMWFGGGGGLYRLEGDTVVYVQRSGPWQ